jgi:hypothetical protein
VLFRPDANADAERQEFAMALIVLQRPHALGIFAPRLPIAAHRPAPGGIRHAAAKIDTPAGVRTNCT